MRPCLPVQVLKFRNSMSLQHIIFPRFNPLIRTIYSGAPAPKVQPKFSLRTLNARYKKGVPLCMVTAYDSTSAEIAARSGVDMILVGDSVGMCVHGRSETRSVTLDEIALHCSAVSRGLAGIANETDLRRPLLIGDLPFGSYLTPTDALYSAARLMKESDIDAVKLEGGERVVPQVRALIDAGIAVMGHVGLTPQTAAAVGGFACQAKTAKQVDKLIDDALALEEAGCFAIVLEFIPVQVAAEVASRLSIPTIGIGAGSGTDGQVLVWHDFTGVYPRPPKFAKQFADVRSVSARAVSTYCQEVRAKRFPNDAEHGVRMTREQIEKLNFTLSAEAQALSDDPENDQIDPESINERFEGIKRVAVIGGGALGLRIAGSLAGVPSVKEVSLVTRRSSLREAIRKSGGITIERNGKTQITPVRAVSSIDEIDGVDLVIVAHKQTCGEEAGYAGRCAAELLRHPNSSTNAVALTLSNGLLPTEFFDQEDEEFQNRVFLGVTYMGSRTKSLASVVASSGDSETVVTVPVPDLEDRGHHVTAKAISELLESIDGVGRCRVALGKNASEIEIWKKLSANAIINSITSLARGKNEILSTHSKLTAAKEMLETLSEEISGVLNAKFSNVDPNCLNDLTADAIAARVRHTADMTDGNVSSMLADVLGGRRTEAGAILGSIISCGEELGVQTPALKTMYSAIECASRSPGKSRENSDTLKVAGNVEHLREILGDLGHPSFATTSSNRSVVGLVPTMGALHQGHLDLIRRARVECDTVVVSVFVNPAQFAPHEDLSTYPRQLERDIEMIQVEGGDVVFAPNATEFYGTDFISYVVPKGMVGEDESEVQYMPEGDSRPGFFRGVATVCTKLFNTVSPHRVYFGQKDAQQCVVIRRLLSDLNFPIELVAVETRREEDGLAMSSRNAYLDDAQRAAAPVVFRALSIGQKRIAEGETNVAAVRERVLHELRTEPLVEIIEYVSVADAATGVELAEDADLSSGTSGVIISTAIKLGSPSPSGKTVRLIDNVVCDNRAALLK